MADGAQLTRRRVIGWMAATPVVLALGRGTALAAPRRPSIGAVYEGESVAARGTGVWAVKARGGFARLGAEVVPGIRAVFSRSNRNDVYVALVGLPAVPTAALYLVVKGAVIRAESWGTGFSGTTVGATNFLVDRGTADQLARAWKVKRKDRTPLGAGLVGRWRAATQPFVVGSPMEITVEIENTGKTAVGFQDGGRMTGRDDHFGFAVEQGGKPLPPIERGGIGGGGGFVYRTLQPGDKIEYVEDVGGWVTIGAAGTYQVRCSFDAELVPGTSSPSWPDHGHQVWEKVLTGTVSVVVR